MKARGRVGSVEEIQWATRRLLEALASEQPLVVCLEVLHWAEPTFLRLVEYLAGCSTGTPILLLAAARDELLDTRPGWTLPRPNTLVVVLGNLSDRETQTLIDGLGERLSREMRNRVAETGAGNPLFLEQLIALRSLGRDGRVGEARDRTCPPGR